MLTVQTTGSVTVTALLNRGLIDERHLDVAVKAMFPG